jgi:DNA (cytosine-5)-methyltransferase 1
MNLRTAVTTLPEAEDLVQEWGEYEGAIRRQEAVTGRAAPLPTEIGPRGGRRLAARFAEWLMALPDGWVTAIPGLSRAQQLHKIGNGVAPAQAYEAYRRLLEL